jgi:hypothetical protein
LVHPTIDGEDASEEPNDEGLDPEFGEWEVQAGFIEDTDHFAEEHEHLAFAFADDGVESKQLQNAEEQGNRDGEPDEARNESDEQLDQWIIHF